MAKANNQNPAPTETEEEKKDRLDQEERNRQDESERERERQAQETMDKNSTVKAVTDQRQAPIIDPNAPIKVNLNPGRTRRVKQVYVGPERDEEGRLTRKGMQEVLQTGIVVRQGEVIGHPDDLPSDEELVHGDEKAKAKLRETLISQKKALDDTIARLT